MQQVDVAIVGAGPFGLSVAACLEAAGVDYRLFGRAMQSWAEAMPEDMFLKSDGFASNLVTPRRGGTLGDFCHDQGIAYHPTALLVSRADFVRYGRAFAARFVRHHDAQDIVALDRAADGAFTLTSATGEVFRARAVVLAVGITHFGVMPAELAELPPDLVSHSYGHACLDRFAGQDVTVVGAGASAVELAAFLARAGAHARLLARAETIAFNSGPMGKPRTLWQRIRRPGSGLGPGLYSWLCCAFPGFYRFFTTDLRLRFLRAWLGPRTPFEYRQTIEERVEVVTGTHIAQARVAEGRVVLDCRGKDGSAVRFTTDHVIAGTGYAPEPARLPFLAPELAAAIAHEEGYPVLDGTFQSSVPGLYFVGLSAAASFGPLMRFVHGARYCAPRVARALRWRLGRKARAA